MVCIVYVFVWIYNADWYHTRTRLEMLNLSHNRLNGIQGVSSLRSLIALNLGEQSSGMSITVHDTDRCYPAGLKLSSYR